MADNPIREYIKAHPFRGPFKPHVHYHRDGDLLNVYWEDARCSASPGGEDFDLYRAWDDQRVVGVRVWGIRRLASSSSETPVPYSSFRTFRFHGPHVFHALDALEVWWEAGDTYCAGPGGEFSVHRRVSDDAAVGVRVFGLSRLLPSTAQP